MNRSLAEYNGNTQIHLNGVQAGTFNISFAGDNTTLTDNGNEGNVNIIADNITIASQKGGDVFSAANPLVFAPNTTDTVNLKVVMTNAEEALNASAYLVTAGTGNVNLHDTEIGNKGLLDLKVTDGHADLNKVGIHQGGAMNLLVAGGNTTMDAVEVSGNMSADTPGGTVVMNNVDVKSTGTLTVTTSDGDITMLGMSVSGSMTATTDAGTIIINTSNINSTGTLNVETGSGDIALNGVNVGGNMSADTQTGNLALNDVNIISGGALGVETDQGDVTVDKVTVDGTLQVTASDGSLLMKDENSILTIGPNSTASQGDTWFDIGRDIGTAQLPFKVNTLPDAAGDAQPLNIKNVVNIYLVQETGASTSDDTLPTTGRDKNGNVGNHEEAIDGIENDDEQVKVTIPAQTPEELAAQLNNGTLTKDQLLLLISGILSGNEVKAALEIDDAVVEELVAALETMEIAELAELVNRLNLGVAEPESKLDLTVLDGEDSEAIKNLALQLNLPADADKETILAELKTRLGLEDTASIEEIKAAYESYYEQVLAQYRTGVINSYRASIESILNTDSKLSDAEINYLFDLGLSEAEAAIAVLLKAALEAQQPVVIGTDGDGNPVYQQAVDENGDPLYMEGTDENGDPILIPVFVMESRLADDKLFEAYWQSLTEAQKQALIEAAWALAKYPEPKDNGGQFRVLVLNIGESTGSSNISNLGDIVITQQTGIFTAEEIFSRYGDVSITGPEITGVDGKTNVTGEDISLTATTGSITGLNVEERSWDLTTIGNIIDEDKKNQAYGQTGSKSWILVRNAQTGQIEMQFAIDYTAVRDLNIENATSITASAAGDIEINEVTGNMGINVIEAGGRVTLTVPGSIYDVQADNETRENIITNSDAVITAGGSVGTNQKYLAANVDGTIQVTAGGDINITDSGSLTLVADSSNGQVNVNAANDLNLSNTTGNLVIGTINAGGKAVIVSVAGIIAGNKLNKDVHIKAQTIDLTAQNGSIGTAEAPIDIDTAAENGGTLSAKATNGAINIRERNGDLIIELVRSEGNGTVNISAAGGIQIGTVTSTGGGDVTLIAENGNITEKDTSDYLAAATEAKLKAIQARSAADLAAAQLIILQNYVANILPELLGRPAAQQALDAAEANLTAAEQALADIQARITTAQEELNILENEKAAADQALADAQAALDQAIADREGLTDPEEIAAQDQLIAEKTQEFEAAQAAVDEKQKELDAKSAEIADLQEQEAELENVTIPELTRLRDEAQSVLDAIDAEIAQAKADLVDTKEAERDSLEATAQTLEAIAAAKLAEAQTAASSITTEGNLNLKLLNGGTIGEEDNSLGVTAAGTVTVTTETGTSIYGLYLESGGNLYLAPVTVDGKVVIDSKGDLIGQPGNTGIIITAANAELSSLGGDIGAASVPLLVNLDRLTAVGEKVYIKNLKDLTIDTVAGSTVNIEATGNITAGSAAGEGNGNNIIADQLELKASGSIGAEGNNLSIDTGEVDVESQNLYLENNSGNLQINGMKVPGQADIHTAGNVVDGGTGNIHVGNFSISAFGNVGESGNPLDVTVTKSPVITASSAYGTVNTSVLYKPGGSSSDTSSGNNNNNNEGTPESDSSDDSPGTVTDSNTHITIIGPGLEGSDVTITTGAPEGQGTDKMSSFIIDLMNKGKVLANYNITVNQNLDGTVTVNIPVGMEYEGQTLTVIAYQNGKMQVINVTVKDGMLSFETDKLTSYAILDDQYNVVPYRGEYTQVGNKQVPMAETQFQDVKADDWYFESIAYNHALKIMEGVAVDLFAPTGIATRSMLAAVLYRLAGSPQVSGSSSFADVEAGSWYADAVAWAESLGIVKGYDNNLFGTNDPVTREQLVVFLYRYTMFKGRDTGASSDLSRFEDAGQISDYALEAMKWAVAVGLMYGRDEGILDPAAPATRAEIATVIQRYIEIFEKVLLVDDDLLE